MKSILIKIILLSFFSISLCAQKIKIEKGVILLDKLPVAKFVKEDSSYEFRSLDDNKLRLKVEVKIVKLYDFKSYKWLLVSNSDNTKSTEVELTYDTKKQVAKLFVEKYQLLNSKGYDDENINDFFNKSRPNLEAKYLSLFEKYKAKVDSALTYAQNIKVDPKSNEIFIQSDEEEVYLGNYSQINELGSVFTIIKNIDNVVVAHAKSSGTAEIKVESKKSGVSNFAYGHRANYRDDNSFFESNFIQELVGYLFVNDIYLDGREKADRENKLENENIQKIQQNKKEFVAAKEASPNFYDIQGEVILDNGDNYKGDLTLKFEAVKNKNDTFGNNLSDATSYGKSVTIKYLNSKGKTKFKSISSKKLPVIKLSNGDVFMGLKVVTDALSIASNGLSSLNFDNSKFYKIIFENDEYLVFEDLPNRNLGIKISKKDKGIVFSSSSDVKNQKKIIKYLGGGVDGNIPQLNYKSKEDLITFLKSL